MRTAAEDHPEEGRLKLTLDVDYNLVLRAMQLKHEEQVPPCPSVHQAQVRQFNTAWQCINCSCPMLALMG